LLDMGARWMVRPLEFGWGCGDSGVGALIMSNFADCHEAPIHF